MASDPNFLETFGVDILPGCACYSPGADGDISALGKHQLGILNPLSVAVAEQLMDMGACPEAMPSLLVILASGVATHLAMRRSGEIHCASDLIPEFRRVMMRMVELMPLEQGRVERASLSFDQEEGIAGRC